MNQQQHCITQRLASNYFLGIHFLYMCCVLFLYIFCGSKLISICRLNPNQQGTK